MYPMYFQHQVNAMETDIIHLPIIPDDPSYYMQMISIIDCYDQLNIRPDFMDDILFIRNNMEKSIRNWRTKNIK